MAIIGGRFAGYLEIICEDWDDLQAHTASLVKRHILFEVDPAPCVIRIRFGESPQLEDSSSEFIAVLQILHEVIAPDDKTVDRRGFEQIAEVRRANAPVPVTGSLGAPLPQLNT